MLGNSITKDFLFLGLFFLTKYFIINFVKIREDRYTNKPYLGRNTNIFKYVNVFFSES